MACVCQKTHVSGFPQSEMSQKRRASSQITGKTFKKQKLAGNPLAQTQVLDKRYALKSDIETKYFHYDFATTAFGVTGGLTTAWTNSIGDSIFIPALGDDDNARNGRVVQLEKINIRGMIDCPVDAVTAGGAAPFIRIVVASLIQAKGDAPLPAEMMTSNGVFAVMNPDNFGQYRILKDKIIQFPYMTSTQGAVAGSFHTEGYTKSFHITHKFKTPLKVKFTNIDGVGVDGSVSENNIFVAAMASNILNGPRMTFHSVCSFKDA